MKKLTIPVNTSNEFLSDCIDCIVVNLSEERIKWIKALSEVVKRLGVYKIAEFSSDCEFMSTDYCEQDEVLIPFKGRVDLVILSITDGYFFWRGYYKNTDISWGSCSVSLERLDEPGELDLR